MKELKITKAWTLFLDRDGVLNKRIIDDYVKKPEELEILPGVPKALEKFNQLFGTIVVVTNQQGIGKGLMTEDDLAAVHQKLLKSIENAGGRIDQFYFAPQLAKENHPDRKPGIGMGLKAKNDFPSIDFSKAIMIGDSESDIEFGMNLEMKTVMLKNSRNLSTKADYIFETLLEVAEAISKG